MLGRGDPGLFWELEFWDGRAGDVCFLGSCLASGYVCPWFAFYFTMLYINDTGSSFRSGIFPLPEGKSWVFLGVANWREGVNFDRLMFARLLPPRQSG